MRNTSQAHTRRSRYGLLFTLALIGLGATHSPESPAEERRKPFSKTSPQWLRAVGKLEVPSRKFSGGYARHYTESCSATLVHRVGSDSADTILTAWHCLDSYSDLSKSIRFSLPISSSPEHTYQARILASGGGMHSDWALLRLDSEISSSESLAIAKRPNVNNREIPLLMAGYSRDSGMGNNGVTLTYDDKCKIISSSTRLTETDCQAYKGASGGPVIGFQDDGAPVLFGVISDGDGATLSRYIPIEILYNALEVHLRSSVALSR